MGNLLYTIIPLSCSDLSLQRLGAIKYDSPFFHTPDFLYPLGYKATRLFPSCVNPGRDCYYTCEVTCVNRDCCEKPEFLIIAEGVCIHAGTTPDAAWSAMLGHLKSTCISAGIHVPASKFSCGEEFFGFTHPSVANLLRALPNADRCRFFERVRVPVQQSVPEIALRPCSCYKP